MYVLIYLLTGTLPWKNLKTNEAGLQKMQMLKRKVPTTQLCEGTTEEFMRIVDYLRNLPEEAELDYHFIE